MICLVSDDVVLMVFDGWFWFVVLQFGFMKFGFMMFMGPAANSCFSLTLKHVFSKPREFLHLISI